MCLGHVDQVIVSGLLGRFDPGRKFRDILIVRLRNWCSRKASATRALTSSRHLMERLPGCLRLAYSIEVDKSNPVRPEISRLRGRRERSRQLEIGGKVNAMKLSLPGQIATQAALMVNNVQQTDYQRSENIDVDFGIFGELI
jgi:hypothetical protein